MSNNYEHRVRTLEDQFKRMRIFGGQGVNVEGDAQRGFAVDTSKLMSGQVHGGGGGPPSDGGGGIVEPPNCALFGFLACDGVSASKTKCGFSEFTIPSVPAKRYLTKTVALQRDWTSMSGASGGACTSTNTIIDNYEEVWLYDPNTCTWTRPCSGSGEQSKVYNLDDPPGCTLHTDIHISDDYCNMVLWPFGLADVYNQIMFGPGHIPGSETTHTVTQTEYFSVFTFSVGTGTASLQQVLSNEYTDDMLRDNTIAALPSFPGTYTSGCTSFYSLERHTSGDIAAIGRLRYKWTSLAAPATCTLRWHEVEHDEHGAEVASVARSLVVTPGMTESPVYNLEEPDTANHSISIVRP